MMNQPEITLQYNTGTRIHQLELQRLCSTVNRKKGKRTLEGMPRGRRSRKRSFQARFVIPAHRQATRTVCAPPFRAGLRSPRHHCKGAQTHIPLNPYSSECHGSPSLRLCTLISNRSTLGCRQACRCEHRLGLESLRLRARSSPWTAQESRTEVYPAGE